jgi:hypothetical protein
MSGANAFIATTKHLAPWLSKRPAPAKRSQADVTRCQSNSVGHEGILKQDQLRGTYFQAALGQSFDSTS